MFELKLSEKVQAKLKKFFVKFDKDNDGAIDAAELKHLLEMNGQAITNEDIEQFVSVKHKLEYFKIHIHLCSVEL